MKGFVVIQMCLLSCVGLVQLCLVWLCWISSGWLSCARLCWSFVWFSRGGSAVRGWLSWG